LRDFFIAFLNSPCYETPKNAVKKKSNKTTEGGKKRDPEKSFFRVFELPLLRNAQKTPFTKIDKKVQIQIKTK
jgi:hypothetical protein